MNGKAAGQTIQGSRHTAEGSLRYSNLRREQPVIIVSIYFAHDIYAALREDQTIKQPSS